MLGAGTASDPPAGFFDPDHAPEAVHEPTFVVVQVSVVVEDSPATKSGFAGVSETVGGGSKRTFTVPG